MTSRARRSSLGPRSWSPISVDRTRCVELQTRLSVTCESIFRQAPETDAGAFASGRAGAGESPSARTSAPSCCCFRCCCCTLRCWRCLLQSVGSTSKSGGSWKPEAWIRPDAAMATSTAAPHGASESTRDIRGWTFVCRKAPAMSSEQREQLAAELCLAPAIPLPEVVFADSTLHVDFAARGVAIHFDAKEALHTWMADHAGDTEHWQPSSFDFKYSTSYKGSVTQERQTVTIDQTTEKLPLDKLQQQVAILFYDRVLLFEDDIRDLGEIYVEVRVRAMEFGFLILCRYYCRVDGKDLKLVDTRYYHEFGDDFVWRDSEIREASISDLKQTFSTQYPDQQNSPIELSGDVVYGMLQPTSSVTEKIRLAPSSSTSS